MWSRILTSADGKVTDMPGTPGWAVWLPVAVGLCALVIGYAVGRRLRVLGRKEQQRQQATGRPAPDLAPATATDWARAERARLVASCADLADRLREHQPALYTMLTRDLAAVGITVELADGELFDAGRYNPVGTEPTSDPAADLRVAATVRLGYADHGSIVRTPDVIVYRTTADGHHG
jgi:hypothetical protein